MKATTKTNTIRSNGVQVMNLKGNQTMYSSNKPFIFGRLKRVVECGNNGRYTVVKQGQFAGLTDQPFEIEIS